MEIRLKGSVILILGTGAENFWQGCDNFKSNFYRVQNYKTKMLAMMDKE